MTKLIYRSYSPGDEVKIIELYEEVYGRRMGTSESANHWMWEFKENPVGKTSITLVWDKDRLVGQYALNPMELKVYNEVIIGALSLDTMIHRDYRKRGVFTKSANMQYSASQKDGVSIVYGFPNGNSKHGFSNKLDWHFFDVVPLYLRPIDFKSIIEMKWKKTSRIFGPILDNSMKLVSRFIPKEKVGSIEVSEVPVFGDWSDDIWRICRDQHNIWKIRDRKYLNWRYNNRPDSNYIIYLAQSDEGAEGFIVLEKKVYSGVEQCFIMEILANIRKKGVADALIRTAIDYATREKCAFLSALVSPSSAYEKHFKKNLFIPVPKRYFPQDIFFGFRELGSKSQRLYDLKNWYISWGDSDLM